MWAKLSQESLSEALSVVRPSASGNSTIPQTLDVLISSHDGLLKLTCTDGETTATTSWIEAQIEKEGKASVPSGMFADFVKALPKGEVILDLNDSLSGITIECQSYQSNINGHNVNDFPSIPTIDESSSSLELNPGLLLENLKRILPGVSKERSRPVLGGVKLDIVGSNYTLAAADGYRLTVDKGELGSTLDTPVGVIIPSSMLRNVVNLLGKGTQKVQVSIAEDKTKALFKIGSVEIVTSLLDGEFPDYNKLLPTSWKTRMTIPIGKLEQATKVAAVFVREGTGIVRLVADTKDGESVLAVDSQSDDIGETHSDLNIKLEGESIKVAFNYNYLNDVISTFEGCDEIVVETASSSSPCLFTSKSLPNYKHVVMPMFVQW